MRDHLDKIPASRVMKPPEYKDIKVTTSLRDELLKKHPLSITYRLQFLTTTSFTLNIKAELSGVSMYCPHHEMGHAAQDYVQNSSFFSQFQQSHAVRTQIPQFPLRFVEFLMSPKV